MTTVPSLPGSDADLWVLDESSIDQAAVDFGVLDLISRDERTRYERLRGARAKRLHLGARLLVRYVLAAYTGRDPQDLGFEIGPYGRPELVPNPDGLQFNLSHTTGLIGCIVTQGRRCGIDVEQLSLPDDVARTLVQFLAAEERADVEAHPPESRARVLLDYWVVKEAYLKALGVGLTKSLDSFTVRGVDRECPRVDDPDRKDEEWEIALRQLQDQHVIAVALSPAVSGRPRTAVRVLDFAAFLRAATRSGVESGS